MGSFKVTTGAFCLFSVLTLTPAIGAPVLTENFDDIGAAVTAGWIVVNKSDPTGTTDWFQGNSGIFSSQQGAANSYVAANFNNTSDVGTISDWLLTPALNLNDGDVFSFYTRTEPSVGYADRMQIRLSTNGASTDVGADATTVGDFTTLLADINPTLDPSGYPQEWTEFTITLSGLGSAQGRLAFRYFVSDAGFFGDNSDYIGLDTVSLSDSGDGSHAVPEPFTMALFGAGLLGMGLFRSKARAS